MESKDKIKVIGIIRKLERPGDLPIQVVMNDTGLNLLDDHKQDYFRYRVRRSVVSVALKRRKFLEEWEQKSR